MGHLERLSTSSAANERCRRQVEDSYQYLLAARPGVVVISNADRYWQSSNTAFGSGPDNASTDEAQKLAALEKALGKMVADLKSRGHGVVIIHTIPDRSDKYVWTPSQCSLIELLTVDDACDMPMPVAVAEAKQSASRNAVVRAGQNEEAVLIDPRATMCAADVCRVRAPNFIRLQDGGHVSVRQAEEFAAVLTNAISASGE